MKTCIEQRLSFKNVRAPTWIAAAALILFGWTSSHAQASSTSTVEHVDRATVSADGTITSQNARWLGHVDHPAAGRYLLTFSPGSFSAAPTCVFGAVADDSVRPELVAATLSCSSATSASVACQARAGTHAANTDLAVICVGP